MLNRTYWKASSSYTSGLLLPTKANVYNNNSIIAGQPIDKSIATSWYKTKFSTLSRNDNSQITKHEVKDYNVFSVFSTLSGNTTVRYDYKGSSVARGGSGWDITRYVCGIDTAIVNLYIPIYLFSTTKGNATVSAVEFINNFTNYKDYTYAIIGKPVMQAGTSQEIALHFIIESETAGGILQISSASSYSSVSSHWWSSPTMCQFNGEGSNTSTNRFMRLNEALVNSSNFPKQWILPYESEELREGEEFNSYEKLKSSFEKYVVVETYSSTVRGCWSPDVIYELIRHVGIPIRDTSAVTSATKIYIPMVDENGYHSGEWVLSTDKKAKDSSLYKTQTDTNTIDPTKPPAPKDGDDIDDMKLGVGRNYAGMIKYYRLSPAQLLLFSQEIQDESVVPAGYDIMKNIIALKRFPTNLNNYAEFGEAELIKIGSVTVPVSASQLDGEKKNIGLGSYTISGYHGSAEEPHFLDFSPYTTAEVFIPYCGFVTIPVDKVMYNTIEVRLLVDVKLGNCTGVVKCNGNIVGQKAGVLGADIPLVAVNMGVAMGAIVQGLMDTTIGFASAIPYAAAGNTAATFSGVLNGTSALTQTIMSSRKNYTEVIGTTGGDIMFTMPDKCYIKLTYPKKELPANYGKMVGYMCGKGGRLGDFKGFTICENVHVNVNATEEEKQMILEKLLTGVIMPY